MEGRGREEEEEEEEEYNGRSKWGKVERIGRGKKGVGIYLVDKGGRLIGLIWTATRILIVLTRQYLFFIFSSFSPLVTHSTIPLIFFLSSTLLLFLSVRTDLVEQPSELEVLAILQLIDWLEYFEASMEQFGLDPTTLKSVKLFNSMADDLLRYPSLLPFVFCSSHSIEGR